MLKKLRIKFVLINMTIVTVMLYLIFGMLYSNTKDNLEKETFQMMNKIVMQPMRRQPPNKQGESTYLPYFSVMVDNFGNIIEIGDGAFDLSDDQLLNEIVMKAVEENVESGILSDYNFRFLKKVTPMGQNLVFVDMTTEQTILRIMVRVFVSISVLAFLVFLAISVRLAKWAIKPVEKAWEQQKQFVADASHELKTPLTVIMTDAELLTAPECTDKERGQLSQSILSMSGQMKGLVESLLDLARVDGMTKKEETKIISLSEIVSDSAMVFEPVFFEKGLNFSYQIQPDIKIKGNGAELKQAVNILLDNAVKYSLQGGEVLLDLSKLSQKKCLLKVSNKGEEIPKEELEHLFKRFYRLDKARTSRNGYGLGLSIAQSITEKHRGRIWAESAVGYNTFYIELPC